ncbi:hypothetical protein ADUPG1_009711 [Aduncisulcus paluster]|uniref:Uncharacterized protein n=1 Tax=Aduncisulcus paluster TaxID=2918883 RepID=A0ABQ5KWI5_9EUKA|nr:hypothetical protein ADUPG1_009711 [Aduncisulcus paluster]
MHVENAEYVSETGTATSCKSTVTLTFQYDALCDTYSKNFPVVLTSISGTLKTINASSEEEETPYSVEFDDPKTVSGKITCEESTFTHSMTLELPNSKFCQSDDSTFFSIDNFSGYVASDYLSVKSWLISFIYSVFGRFGLDTMKFGAMAQ